MTAVGRIGALDVVEEQHLGAAGAGGIDVQPGLRGAGMRDAACSEDLQPLEKLRDGGPSARVDETDHRIQTEIALTAAVLKESAGLADSGSVSEEKPERRPSPGRRGLRNLTLQAGHLLHASIVSRLPVVRDGAGVL